MTDLVQAWRTTSSRALPATMGLEYGTLVVRPRGDIDSRNAGQLVALVMGARNDDDPAVIVDLGHVDFIDTAAVTALLMCEARLDAIGVRFGVRNAFEEVARMLVITRSAHLVEECHDADRPVPGAS